MNATSPRIPSMDADGQDETLRPVDGFDRTMGQRALNGEQEEQNSDDSDLFLKLAREEAANNLSSRGLIRRVSCVVLRPTYYPLYSEIQPRTYSISILLRNHC
jgi:hypothetical protein